MPDSSEVAKKVKEVEENFHKDLEAKGLTALSGYDFPKYKILPDSVRLALLVLKEETK